MGDESYRWASIMTRLYIICEGQSEQEFVDGALAPYIRGINPNLDISSPILKSKTKNQSHKGGCVSYHRLKLYIETFNKQERCLITTLVDYYGLENDFPDYRVIQTIPNVYNRIEKLESTIASHIQLSNFIPYIQIHEYEMFYFADLDNFINLDAELNKIYNEFIAVNTQTDNPELINDGIHSAPSKRIEKFFNKIDLKYKKPYYAALYSQSCNIEILRNKCRHFNAWLEKLLAL